MARHLLVTLALAPACTPECEAPTGTQVRFDAVSAEHDGTPETWLRFPFPSDHRRTDVGTVALEDFPNPESSGELAHFKRTGEEVLRGFSTLAPVYMAFDDAIDPTTLPTEPPATMSSTSSMQLIDISPSSPDFGDRLPVRWQYWGVGGKYVPANTLAVAPAWGFPLRERTTYALVITTDVRDLFHRRLKSPPLLQVTLGSIDEACIEQVPKIVQHQLDDAFGPLADRLSELELAATDIAAATVFTTQDITAPLVTIRAQIHGAPAPTASEWQEVGGSGVFHQELSYPWNASETVDYRLFEGRYGSPNYQTGDLPYAAPRDGGEFKRAEGVLAVDHMEQLRFVLTVPVAPPADGGPCYPIVLYAHGTGGDAYSFSATTGGRLAARGLAAISIDQPMHGPRDGNKGVNVELMTFNYFNLHAARTNLRQSSVDTFVLTRLVRESLTVPAAVSPTDADICFDESRVFFFGHSQGGLTGAMAAAIETDVPTWVLSGAGGGLSITLMERKDFADFEQLIRLFLYMDAEDEPLSELHPAVGLIQSLVDITDPLNYSPHWLQPTTRSSAVNVLLTSGEHDAATPHRTAAAMAVAGHVPAVEPVVIDIPAYDWASLDSTSAPVSGNVEGRTAGFLQWGADGEDDSHWLIFRRPEAINASMRFLESAAYAANPIIERVPGADVR